ncbi:hypothetical protein [Microcoleus asticus]|uniref:Uncharacterized protein n=1 Tax=Microcoleus asticus IPMA8 TaxID=2563858 RepID=A0ABX2D7C7_9CYAN|nr:hypothetical protein [Microcoleus asticus]NQE37520.1 hypothetical protein [Microcoleus asticus IPMA8]
MNQEQHGQGQESTTSGIRGEEGGQSFHSDTYRSTALAGAGTRLGTQLLELDRENSSQGIGDFDPFGGVIDQLIDDAKKQLVKSQECIVWYRSEAEEYKQKLDNLVKLKELQQQQQQLMQQQQQALLQQQAESSNQNGGEAPAE